MQDPYQIYNRWISTNFYAILHTWFENDVVPIHAPGLLSHKPIERTFPSGLLQTLSSHGNADMQVPLFTHTLVMDAGTQALSVYVYLKRTIDDWPEEKL